MNWMKWTLACFLASHAQFLDPSAMAAFKVGGVTYTRGKIDTAVQRVLQENSGNAPTSPEKELQVRASLVQEAIQLELLKLEAQALKIKISNSDVAQAFNAEKSQFPSAQVYKQFLASRNWSEEQFKVKIRDRMAAMKVIEKAVPVSRKAPSEKEMLAFFQTHKNEFPVNDSVAAMRIMLKSKGADAKALLDGLAAQVRMKKAPFPALAAQFSDDPMAKRTGGAVKPFIPSDYGADCANALRGLSVGAVSRVCTYQGSSQMFWITARNDGSYKSYKDRIGMLVMMNRERERAPKIEGYVKSLRAKYPVQFFDPAYDPERMGDVPGLMPEPLQMNPNPAMPFGAK